MERDQTDEQGRQGDAGPTERSFSPVSATVSFWSQYAIEARSVFAAMIAIHIGRFLFIEPPATVFRILGIGASFITRRRIRTCRLFRL
ncbi:hypothetical protein NFI95_07755 [Acetobacteraceae bacterium KSS8]|uniref:Uncharacterized protein n=1 Tax=Endosaccharibacter trunci TaxID=2812733 RepID=A0ABT1W629_9PROT|nr:hypothetical protein [Acetobacteraceae bacterium KSS8]